jgi:hypothetical protein
MTQEEKLQALMELLEQSKQESQALEPTALIPDKIEGSPNMTNKVKQFDEIADDLARTLGDDVVETTVSQPNKELAKKYLTEARTRAMFKNANPEMYGKLGREALDNAKKTLGVLSNKAVKTGAKALSGIGMLMEPFDAEAAGPIAGSDSEIIENPQYPLELRQAAMKRMKDKYLKPKEELDE